MQFPYTLIDLTHTLDEKSPAWDPACSFNLGTALDYDQCSTDVKFRVNSIHMPAGTMGTHMDVSAHCIPGGGTIDQLPLKDLISPCVVIDVSPNAHQEYRVSVHDIEVFEKQYGMISAGTLVIVRTGWDQFWHDPEQYRNDCNFPSVTVEAARLLLQRGVVGLGIDTFSADRPQDEFRVHEAMLGAGKYLVESIANAHLLPPVGSFVGVFPLKIKDATESPIRLIGMIPQ